MINIATALECVVILGLFMAFLSWLITFMFWWHRRKWFRICKETYPNFYQSVKDFGVYLGVGWGAMMLAFVATVGVFILN